MKDFATLFADLDASTSTRAKTDALLHYFHRAQPADAAWALYFLAGGKPRQTVATITLGIAHSRVLRKSTGCRPLPTNIMLNAPPWGAYSSFQVR